MTRAKRLKRCLVVAVVLLVVGGLGYGAFAWHKAATAVTWPELLPSKKGGPQVSVKLADDRDFGYFCGSEVRASLYLKVPKGWEPELASFGVKGDLELMEAKSYLEVQPDGAINVRYDVMLQTVNPNGFKWTAAASVRCLHDGKLETVDFPPIKISGSKTFDDDKESKLKTPPTQYQGWLSHGLVTGAFLLLGACGWVVFPLMIMRGLFPKKPKVNKEPAAPPADPNARVKAAFSAVIHGGFADRAAMLELSLAVRERFQVPENKFPEELLEGEENSQQRLIGLVLQISEGSCVWQSHKFELNPDLVDLRDYGLALLNLPEGSFDWPPMEEDDGLPLDLTGNPAIGPVEAEEIAWSVLKDDDAQPARDDRA